MDSAITTNVVPNGQQQPIKTLEEAQAQNTSSVSSDFETFLRLLTTQLENQDPLKPMESSEFAVQLATFSGVEQQVKTNDLLDSLVTQSDSAGLSDLASWVGMEARSPAGMYFDGTSLEVNPSAVPGADRAMLVIKSAEGLELGRLEIPNDGQPYTWLGTGSDGVPLPAGTYKFSVDAFAGGSQVSSKPIETYGTVTEVQTGLSGPILILANGSQILATDVTAVRAPSG